jgi:type IX secretion system PorP/SprF family membrane protein
MKKILIGFLITWLCWIHIAKAQDPHFSQFYSNTLYTNPAFAGASGNVKVSLSGRKQFTNIPKGFYTSTASIDMPINKSKSSLGFMGMFDQAGSASYTTSSISAVYAYKLRLDRNVFMSFAIQGEFVNRSLDRSDLVFADQLETEQGIVKGTDETIGTSQRFYPNFSTGVLLFTKDLFAGIAVHNLAEPNQSFIQTNSRDKSNLHLRRYTLHAGINLYTSRYWRRAVTLSPNILCMFQGQTAEVNLGFYARKKGFTTGLWMRQTMNNADAVIMMMGYKYKNMTIGYSYDLGIGKLAASVKRAHEISIQWEISSRNYKVNPLHHPHIPCPKM